MIHQIYTAFTFDSYPRINYWELSGKTPDKLLNLFLKQCTAKLFLACLIIFVILSDIDFFIVQ